MTEPFIIDYMTPAVREYRNQKLRQKQGVERLCQAARMINPHVLEELITIEGFSPEARTFGGLFITVLMVATENTEEGPRMVQVLLNHGAKLETRDGEGKTALHYAAINGNAAVADTLLNSGADVNAQCAMGNTPLRLATQNEERNNQAAVTAVVRVLLNAGADPNIRNRHGISAFDFASQETSYLMQNAEQQLRNRRR